jgi:hypothetical protein
VVQVLWSGFATAYDQDPLLMRLPNILGAPFMVFILGLGLEIVAEISKQNSGTSTVAL